MGRRSNVVAVIALLLALIAGMWGARLAARNLLVPLAGLDRLDFSAKPHVSEPEPVIEEMIRAIDWDAPAPAPSTGMARSNPSTTARAGRAFTLSMSSGEALAVPKETEIRAGVMRLVFESVGEREFQAVLILGDEPNIETMASTLNLSDSQKARISALMEWKRATLEALTDAEKADPERIRKIEDYFRAALDLELDQDQARQYAKSRSTVLRFNVVQQRAVQALEKDATEVKPGWLFERLVDPAKK